MFDMNEYDMFLSKEHPDTRNVTRDGEQSRQAAAKIVEWLAAAWNGRHMVPWLACAFFRAAHGHPQAL